MTTPKPQIGWVGLGAMGFGMATNLLAHGYAVKGYDVWAPSLARFTAAGGTPASSLAESARDCPFYVCMVASAAQAQDALFDSPTAIVPALPHGATLLLCSTVPASYALSVAAQLHECGRADVAFIDAPVSGGTGRAADGTLSIMVGAEDGALAKGKWLLEEMADGEKLFVVDGGVGQGSNMKMVHQVLAGVQILAVSEAMGFAARLGLDAEEVRAAAVGDRDGAWSWMFENRVQRMLKEDYFPGVSALTIILKDVVCVVVGSAEGFRRLTPLQGIITSQARLHGFPVPLVAASEQAFLTGLSLGWGAHDDAGMVRLYTSAPVSTPPPIPAPDAKAATALVKAFLVAIHAAAAVEALAFTRALGISLQQFYRLASDAAGGSAQFRSVGREIVEALGEGKVGGDGAGTATLDETIKNLGAVVDEMQRLKMPAYLASTALQVLMVARRVKSSSGESKVSGVIAVYGL